ncbi:MAG TPA: class I SAM-dependent methyltransferase [Oscillospiraceae bacterium]|nr:class I SAM-dependent methyltransferase [Oscillospiraceae bacterium]HNW05204.1 class I SAM-dependent methyltransferase [Oscillospiraceae bacterium]
MAARSEWNALEIVRRMVASRVKPGDFCIDATAGNGGDTAFLCGLVGPEGRVLAFDIQEPAVEATRRLAAEGGFADRLEVVLESHSEMDRYAAPESADCILFNFGWLPGGDHDVVTRAETSVPAIQKSLEILKPGGLLSLCLYYGRNNGFGERDAILEELSGVDFRRYTVMKCDFLNRPNNPPFPIFVLKEG